MIKKSYLCFLISPKPILLRLGPLLISIAFLFAAQPFAKANAITTRYTVESIDFDFGQDKPTYKPKKLLEKLGFETGDDAIWAESGTENLLTFYREKGLAFAQVSLRREQLPEGKLKLTYVIDEGPKVTIGKVMFRGNETLKTDALKNALKTPTKKWFFWARNYVQEQVTEDVKRLSGIYWEKGYLAHSITYSLNPDILEPAIVAQQLQEKKTTVNINFVINEGPLYYVDKILLKSIDAEGRTIEDTVLKSSDPTEQLGFTEHKAFSVEQLRALVELEPGQIYSEKTAKTDVKRLKKLYGENGFIDARVRLLSPEFIPDSHAVNIIYEIFEGRQY